MSGSYRYLKVALTLVIALLALSRSVGAQDLTFSQFYMNPVYMNPAYAGSMKVPRLGVQYRNQWPGFGNTYITSFAAFDAYVPKISGGIGFYFLNDLQGGGVYAETSFRMIYSKEIRLNRSWTMYGGLSLGAQMSNLQFGKLIFQDGIDGNSSIPALSGETAPEHNRRIFPDFGTGLLFFNDQLFWGVAADHLTQPDQSIYSDDRDKIPTRFTVHLELNKPWFWSGHLRKYLKLNPNLIVQSQGREQSCMYGIYANRMGKLLGLWNRFTTLKSSDLIAMAGFMNKQLRCAITYDINIRGVGLQSQGAVEISVSWLLRDAGEKSRFPFYEIPGEWDLH